MDYRKMNVPGINGMDFRTSARSIARQLNHGCTAGGLLLRSINDPTTLAIQTRNGPKYLRNDANSWGDTDPSRLLSTICSMVLFHTPIHTCTHVHAIHQRT
jgi:hypothetical protein